MKKSLKVQLIAVMLSCIMVISACNTWPVIIATAEAIASLATVVDPALQAYSQLAVQLLQTAEAAVNAYNANKTQGNLIAAQSAIIAIESQLPAELAKLNVSPAITAEVTAAMNIILDYVEALAVMQPGLAQVAVNMHNKRVTAPMPATMTKKQIIARWQTEVCHNIEPCSSLVK